MTERFDQSEVEDYEVATYGELPLDSVVLRALKARGAYFLDINKFYTLDKEGILVQEAEAVRRQITNVLSTIQGSEPFEPTFGSLLPYRLMDPITKMTAWLIYNDSIGAVNKWLGERVVINGTQSYVTPYQGSPDGEGYEIYLAGTLVRAKSPFVYNVAVLR